MQFIEFILEVYYIASIIHQQLWGYKVEEKFHLGLGEQKG
jgi:hypothetical protein